jgi:ADP-ribosylglycohydrolase
VPLVPYECTSTELGRYPGGRYADAVDDLRDRAFSAILGLVVGDALGAPFEFQRAAQVPDPLPAFERSWMGRPPGTWTDDTAMARNLWTSLIAHGGALDLDDVLVRHLDWIEGDPPDVGSLTRRVLTRTRDGVSDAARAYV